MHIFSITADHELWMCQRHWLKKTSAQKKIKTRDVIRVITEALLLHSILFIYLFILQPVTVLLHLVSQNLFAFLSSLACAFIPSATDRDSI